jgi:hypothetical protein
MMVTNIEDGLLITRPDQGVASRSDAVDQVHGPCPPKVLQRLCTVRGHINVSTASSHKRLDKGQELVQGHYATPRRLVGMTNVQTETRRL